MASMMGVLRRTRWGWAVGGALLAAMALLGWRNGTGVVGATLPTGDYRAAAFQLLRQVRDQRKAEVESFLRAQWETAAGMVRQPVVREAFSALLAEYRAGRVRGAAYAHWEAQLELFYAQHLGLFHDLLLVAPDGTLFFTVKKEHDFLANLNGPAFQGLALARAVAAGGRSVRFVDYQHYAVSGEPASFHVVPLWEGERQLGRVVLQLPLNGLNGLLTRREGLGRTGEVYLVNQRRAMLTESRFSQGEGALGEAIGGEAVDAALARGKGERVVTDYRGRRVLSAYDRITFQGSAWAILAEMDESEVITRAYQRHQAALLPLLLERLAQEGESGAPHPAGAGRLHALARGESPAMRVDLGEFHHRADGTPLYTMGVATCTALAVQIPGRFGYLAHITPTDAAYGVDGIAGLGLGTAHSDLVNQVMERLTWFQLIPRERSQVRVDLLATRSGGLQGILARLLEHGLLLDQVRIHYRPRHDTVSVVLDYRAGELLTVWRGPGGNGVDARRVMADQGHDLATLVDAVLRIRDTVRTPG